MRKNSQIYAKKFSNLFPNLFFLYYCSMKTIAHIHSDFPTKFGIPRQSGIIDTLKATIVFEPEYRNPDAFRGLEDFSHIWLIWEFSEAVRDDWSPTVRPPRLGGNARKGVFATRSAEYELEVQISDELLAKIPETQRESLIAVLAHDPRPQYHDDPERIYGMEFGKMEVKFRVERMRLTVMEIATSTTLSGR